MQPFSYLAMNKSIIFILLLASFILTLRLVFFYSNLSVLHDGQAIRFTYTLLQEPKQFSRYQQFTAKIGGQRILVRTGLSPKLSYGDRIIISGQITSFTPKTAINQDTRVLTLNSPSIKLNKGEASLGVEPLIGVAAWFHERVKDVFAKALPSRSASLLLGIVFGIREGIDHDFSAQLASTGVLHVVAASGMNVTLVGGFLSSLFSLMLRRQFALVFTIMGIFFYALLSGLDASIVRASLMGMMTFGAQIIGRQYMASYALFLTAFFMLMLNPDLSTDIGFQLSFAATTGLIWIQPVLSIFLRGGLRKVARIVFFREDLKTTIAAQLAVTPLLLLYFGTYSLWSVVVNALVLWTIPPLMVIGGLAGLLSLIFPFFASLLLYVALPLLLYFEAVVSFFAPFSQTDKLENLPWQLIAGYYLLLISAILYIKMRK